MTEKGKINVLQIVEGLGSGGAETKLLELVEHIDSNRFNTILMSLGFSGHVRDLRVPEGVEFVTLSRRCRFDLLLIRDLVHLMKDREIDIVMTTLFYADVMGAIASRLAGVKAMFSWETISSPKWLVKHRLWLYRFAMRYCDFIISVSRATADWLVKKRGMPEEKVIVIPYGVDDKKFTVRDGTEMRKKLNLAHDDIVLGTAARLHSQKGHRYLLDALPRLVSEFPKLKWVIAGEGDLRDELEAIVGQKGVASHVFFLGHCTNVHELLPAFDIFVLPSLYEGLPNCVLEAMAAGKPIVASAVDGTVEAVVDGETGVLVPPGDPDRLYNALSRLIKDEDLRNKMGMSSRKRVEDIFSLSKQVQAFENLYEEYSLKAK